MYACTGEGNGDPLQYSCLENPRDRGAWWAAIYGANRVGHEWTDLAATAAEEFVFGTSFGAAMFKILNSPFYVC